MIEINLKLIIIKLKLKKNEILNLYFKYKENKQIQIITKESEIIICPSFIKYFEIILNGINNSAISIGNISNPNKLKKESMIGWDKGTIGLHTDGKVYTISDFTGKLDAAITTAGDTSTASAQATITRRSIYEICYNNIRMQGQSI